MPFFDTKQRVQSPVFIAVLLIVGMLLRLVWLQDMEWKADEKLMYSLAQSVYEKGSMPALGMPSGVGLPNAGFSVVPFALFYAIAADPVCMTLAVALGNCLALLFFFRIAAQLSDRREVFIAGVGIVAVNVLMVLYSRKLWAQDLLPLFIAGMWWMHTQRRFLLALAGIGFLGVLAGQLHISGFFYLAGLCIAMWLGKQLQWKSILALVFGVALGLIPAFPWIREVLTGAHTSNTGLHNVVKFEYFLHLLTDPAGVNVQYSLGPHVKDYVQYFVFIPVLWLLGIAAVTILGLWKRFQLGFSGWRINMKDSLHFYTIAFVLLPGVLLTISGSPIRSHYLIAAAPFAHAVLAALWLKAGQKWFLVGLLCQLLLTLSFIVYVHQFGAPQGDYGLPYRMQ